MRMTSKLLLLGCLIINVIDLLVSGTGTPAECENNDVRLVEDSFNDSVLVMQREGDFFEYCSGQQWRRVCGSLDDGWETSHGIIACAQLGYSVTAPTMLSSQCSDNPTTTFIKLSETCAANQNTLEECRVMEVNNCSCQNKNGHGALQCGPACSDGEFRLRDGTNNVMEGRVEVCVGKSWKVVCYEDQQEAQQVADTVCSIILGAPVQGIIRSFSSSNPPNLLPLYNCNVKGCNRELSCTSIIDSDQSCMELGVECSRAQIRELCSVTAEEPTGEAVTNCPTINDCNCITNSTAITVDYSASTGHPEDGNNQNGVSVPILGAIIALLGAVIISLAMGWVTTCFVMRKRSAVTLKPINGTQQNQMGMSYEVPDQEYIRTTSKPEPANYKPALPLDPCYDVATGDSDDDKLIYNRLYEMSAPSAEVKATYDEAIAPEESGAVRVVENGLYGSTGILEHSLIDNPLCTESTSAGKPK